MPCPCQQNRRPLLGRAVAKKPKPKPKAGSGSVTASASGSWGTTCSAVTYASLLRAQAAARACGGQVRPA